VVGKGRPDEMSTVPVSASPFAWGGVPRRPGLIKSAREIDSRLTAPLPSHSSATLALLGGSHSAFQGAQIKLIAYVRERIQNGDLTERGLARRIGISQPHVHNVLSGVRNLSPEILDCILEHFQMSLLDLATAEELEANLRRRALERTADAAVLAGTIGPGMPWTASVEHRARFPLPFRSLVPPPDLVMARLGADSEMSTTLAGDDMALLDISEPRRREIVPEGLYVICRGHEAVLRYIHPGAHSYYLSTDSNQNEPICWEPLRVTIEELFGAVQARVRWLGRECDRNLPVTQRGRFLYDPIST
jgi:transcriptional regulator with XRE-family HTH domain